METSVYAPFILLGTFTAAVMLILFIWSEYGRKKSEAEMTSFMRFAHIESVKNSKDVQRMIDKNHRESNRILNEIQKTNRQLVQINKDNSLFLHRIFEIIDDPEKKET